MKLLNILFVSSIAFVGSVSAADFVAADNSRATQVCMSVVKDNKVHLLNTLRETHLNKREVKEKLHCNDIPVAKFAARYGFAQSAEYLGVTNTKTSIQDIAMLPSSTLVISGSK
ncbi:MULTISPECIES: DUF3718 domain-containing protein [unclassified Pseudoalteromonas]|uniref:DUF3718 domain-containing protein n=1 Tax=unclassified Pseudoalteromonas TaxID=194690 RepID=UPI0030143681